MRAFYLYDNTRLRHFLNAWDDFLMDVPDAQSVVFCSHPDDDGIGLVLLEHGDGEAPDLAEAFWTQSDNWWDDAVDGDDAKRRAWCAGWTPSVTLALPRSARLTT